MFGLERFAFAFATALQELKAMEENIPRVIQVGDIWYVELPDCKTCRIFEMEVRKVGKEIVELSVPSTYFTSPFPKTYRIKDVVWVEISQRKSQEIPAEYP